MSHKLVLTSVGVWKSHCFLRQLRRLSWVVFHSHERREWRGGGGLLWAVLQSLRQYAVAQLVEALRYKSEDRGFDSRW